MKLTKVRITEFQSIQDSTEFEIGDVTCLVGKNEAGKTALLKALYRLNPVIEGDGDFDPTDDYPRRAVSDYEEAVDEGQREPATVVRATFELESADIAAVEEMFGIECIEDETPTLTLEKGYSNELTVADLNVNEEGAILHLVEEAGLTPDISEWADNPWSVGRMIETLADAEQTEGVQRLLPMLEGIREAGMPTYIFREILQSFLPKFLYFDEYYQMKGQDNVEALRQRVAQEQLNNSDHPLLGLIELARLDLGQLVEPKKTTRLVSKLEGAANRLTDHVLKYWSQNRHVRMEFDVRPAQPEDPKGMTSGTNIWGYVEDTKHHVSTTLATRSRGFIWFFSFLAWYSKLRKDFENIVLLLDEPGLSLHAKAQGDLLRYFEGELKPHHQLVYTTHSPFMVDPSRFDRVRIVQDLNIEADSDNLSPEEQGTKVITEVLEATPDSLFPLQGALGYEIHQSLFIGPNCLVVEGVSDLLYIQTLSAHLQRKGRTGLRPEWTVTPVGGSDKVSTFVALIGAQSHLNVAVLIDFHKKDRQSIENLYKSKLLKQKKVLTYADFVEGDEADIEDMFGPELYLQLVNGAFGSSVQLADLSDGHPRILRRLEEYLTENPLPGDAKFNHYRPARYLVENLDSVEKELGQTVLDRFQAAFDALNKLL